MSSARVPPFLIIVPLLSFLIAPLEVAGQSIEGFKREQSSPGFSFELPEEKGPARVDVRSADRQEAVSDEYVILEGNVEIVYRGIRIRADSLTANLRTRDVTAEGNVIVDQGVQRLSGDKAIFNLDSETGTVFTARASFEPSVYFQGEKIEKIDDDTFILTNGTFTSCDIDDPSWSFRVQRAEITVDDYARLHDLSFRARNFPLIYTPYLIWPTKRGRARGFLIPKVGYSSRFGAYLGNAYFIPLGDSADVTVLADVYSEGYFGLGSEVRYVPSTSTKGDFNGQVIRDPEADTAEWRYDFEHTQDGLPGGFRGVVDVEDYSDLNFFREFSREFDLNTKSNIYSAAYLTRNRDQLSLNIKAERRKYFVRENEERVYEQLPAIELRAYPRKIGGTPAYFSGQSSVGHLRTNLGANYYRADVSPTVSLQLRTPLWLSVKPQLQLRQTWYSSSVDPATGTFVDESLSRGYAQGEVEMIGPTLSRVYSRSLGGFARFKHVIEPRVRYLYTTEVADQNRVIAFDSVDSPRLPLVRDTVEYGLTQRLLAKESTENASAREILTFSVRQSAALSEPFGEPVGGFRDRSPVAMNLRFNPYSSISIDGETTLEDESFDVASTSLSARLQAPASPAFLAMTYFASFATDRSSYESSQVRFAGGIPLIRDRIRVAAQLNYDAQRAEFLDQRFLVDFAASCYSVALEYRDFEAFGRTDGRRRNRDYLISVSLRNVGTFVDLRGSLDAN